MDFFIGKVQCNHCGEWVTPIYGGDRPNCGEVIEDYEDDQDEDF